MNSDLAEFIKEKNSSMSIFYSNYSPDPTTHTSSIKSSVADELSAVRFNSKSGLGVNGIAKKTTESSNYAINLETNYNNFSPSTVSNQPNELLSQEQIIANNAIYNSSFFNNCQGVLDRFDELMLDRSESQHSNSLYSQTITNDSAQNQLKTIPLGDPFRNTMTNDSAHSLTQTEELSRPQNTTNNSAHSLTQTEELSRPQNTTNNSAHSLTQTEELSRPQNTTSDSTQNFPESSYVNATPKQNFSANLSNDPSTTQFDLQKFLKSKKLTENMKH
jgi:hypothetical protein